MDGSKETVRQVTVQRLTRAMLFRNSLIFLRATENSVEVFG